VDGLVHGRDAMPEYANSVQRIAMAVVDNENGKAFRIVDARGEYWTFDEEGKINKGCLNRWPRSCRWSATSDVETTVRSLA
jgi:hypothetical protein